MGGPDIHDDTTDWSDDLDDQHGGYYEGLAGALGDYYESRSESWEHDVEDYTLQEPKDSRYCRREETEYALSGRGHSLNLTANKTQLNLIKTRTKTGYRRVKGPAGSGKTLVIAARASELLNEGKKVLVVTFNNTLHGYIRYLSREWSRSNFNSEAYPAAINIHQWFKRVCKNSGNKDEYTHIMSRDSVGCRHLPFSEKERRVENLVASILDDVQNDREKYIGLLYDAILVDEGQDFKLLWWNLLRGVLKKDGEMLLVADATQDIYERSSAWTDQAMKGSGFVGGWATLDISYRLPEKFVPIVREFAQRHLPQDKVDLPNPSQAGLALHPVKTRWVSTTYNQSMIVCMEEVVAILNSDDEKVRLVEGLAVLVPDKVCGELLIGPLDSLGDKFTHTFHGGGKEEREKKNNFFLSKARIKLTTLHSFKGLESKAVVLYTGNINDTKNLTLIYTAMTRLKRCTDISVLTVISSLPELDAFGKEFFDEFIRK